MLASGMYGFDWDPLKTAIFVGAILLVVILFTLIGWYWPWSDKRRTRRDGAERE